MEVIVWEGMLWDLSFLREMLFEAAFWRPSVQPTSTTFPAPGTSGYAIPWLRSQFPAALSSS